MSSCREILTFQFGNYSNFIGAHWWNIQEFGFNYDPDAEPSEINHEILYREGKNLQGQITYTPRLLSVDLRGALGYLTEGAGLYEEQHVVACMSGDDPYRWDPLKNIVEWEASKVEVVTQNFVEKPEFQKDLDDPNADIENKDYNFSESAHGWPDFLYSRYHPRTIETINEYEHSLEKDMFDSFPCGRRTWETPQFEDDFCDKIRFYIEECDSCQGFQTMFDCNNAFSGLAIKCLEYLKDEYSKTTFALPVFSPKPILFDKADDAMSDTIRTVNTALSYVSLVENSAIFLPLCTKDRAWRQMGQARTFPVVQYQSENLYETSAILASYLDTITLRYRLRNPSHTSNLLDFSMDLTNYGRKLTAAGFSYPLPMRSDQDLIDCLDQLEGKLFTQLSPGSEIGNDYIVQSICVRGVPRNRLKRPLKSAQKQMKMAAYKCESVSEMLQLYFQCENHCSLAHVSAVQSPLTIRTPYPSHIFSRRLNFEGFMSDIDRLEDQKLLSIPTAATIQNSGDLSQTLEKLHYEANRIKIAKIHRFREMGLESDEYAEALENLLQFKDKYEDNYDL